MSMLTSIMKYTVTKGVTMSPSKQWGPHPRTSELLQPQGNTMAYYKEDIDKKTKNLIALWHQSQGEDAIAPVEFLRGLAEAFLMRDDAIKSLQAQLHKAQNHD